MCSLRLHMAHVTPLVTALKKSVLWHSSACLVQAMYTPCKRLNETLWTISHCGSINGSPRRHRNTCAAKVPPTLCTVTSIFPSTATSPPHMTRWLWCARCNEEDAPSYLDDDHTRPRNPIHFNHQAFQQSKCSVSPPPSAALTNLRVEVKATRQMHHDLAVICDEGVFAAAKTTKQILQCIRASHSQFRPIYAFSSVSMLHFSFGMPQLGPTVTETCGT
ncbi:hypothetical protein TcWFU_003461 [Taenia crassiceps]|uniref:Uncharacterized protein n=1 Tax=Taenia crassiceps TaxID=6207 RepID=A0ABR4QAQ6_9CEST